MGWSSPIQAHLGWIVEDAGSAFEVTSGVRTESKKWGNFQASLSLSNGFITQYKGDMNLLVRDMETFLHSLKKWGHYPYLPIRRRLHVQNNTSTPEHLKIKDANEGPGLELVAYQKRGFPTQTWFVLKTRTKTIQNPYKTHTKLKRLYAFPKKVGFPAKNPDIFENL